MITEKPSKVYCFVNRYNKEVCLPTVQDVVLQKFMDIEARYKGERLEPIFYYPKSIQEAKEVIELMQYYISQKEKEND